jgi:WhiB family redox-sensing transcriptional regulator
VTDRWLDRAACRDLDADEFFDDGADLGTEAAHEACRRCSVRSECLADALETGDTGFRAGTTPAERRSMRRKTPKPVSPFAGPEHGTEAGYLRHRRADEDACEWCKGAHAVAEQLRRHSA